MPTSATDHLADNIKAIRETRGLSQQQIAKAAGIPRATWTALESGAANPTLAVLVTVAAAREVAVAGERYTLAEGDVVIFRGDQRHAYFNPGKTTTIAYSAIAFAPRM